MAALRRIRHSIADSVRRFLKSPTSSARLSPSRLFFKKKGDSYSDLTETPNSTRSVSFTDAITWPYIDDDECTSGM